jgi:hypothetical protein
MCGREAEMDDAEMEQLADMHWATKVLAGIGSKTDKTDVALQMLTTMAQYGATPSIRAAACVARSNSMRFSA